MFIHIFTYRLKCSIRDKEMVFWTMLFPLILATLFHLAFSNISENERFNPISIAVVNNEQYQQNHEFKEVLKDVSNGEDRIFNLTEASEKEADNLLKDGAVAAYIILNPETQMIVRRQGMNQTIVKIFLEEYNQTAAAVASVFAQGTENMDGVLSNLTNRLEFTKGVSITDAEPDLTLNYFYSLLAMACFYGAFWGAKEIIDIQANLSPRAARMNLSPVHKMKAFIFSLTAVLLIQYTQILILLTYLHFALGIDFGSKIGYVLLTTLVGSIVGITFGAFISSTVKKSEGVKIAILLSFTMLCSFLSGMMFHQMKYIVSEKAPVLSYLNPVNLLTDAFYSLYYFDGFNRYWLNMGALSVFIIFFCLMTYLILRRHKYASI